jgi:hypothetical protein
MTFASYRTFVVDNWLPIVFAGKHERASIRSILTALPTALLPSFSPCVTCSRQLPDCSAVSAGYNGVVKDHLPHLPHCALSWVAVCSRYHHRPGLACSWQSSSQPNGEGGAER